MTLNPTENKWVYEKARESVSLLIPLLKALALPTSSG